MKDSVIIRDVSRHEGHDTTDPNIMPFKKNVAAPDVAMSASLVMYDKELSYAEDNNDDDDYNNNGNGDDDGKDTKKFATPTSKQWTAGSEKTN